MTIAADTTARPDVSRFARVPLALTECSRWCLWKYETPKGRDKVTKVPYQTGGQRAASDDPRTWCDYQAALDAYAGGAWDGIGFFLGGGFGGIDLDCSLDESGELKAWARPLAERVQSYAEVSPSGRGVKIIAYAEGEGGTRKARKDGEPGEATEVYFATRFFTVTGNHFDGWPETVENCEGAMQAIFDELKADRGKRERRNARPLSMSTVVTASDDELIERGCRARNGDGFARLWSGDTSAHGDDASSADLALCNHLAFWTRKDAAQIDRLFRGSGLMRPKWDERHSADGRTYGQMTIDEALAGTTNVYEPRPPLPPPQKAPLPPPTAEEIAAIDQTGSGNQNDGDRATELANAEETARRFGRDIRYNVHSGKFIVFDERCWADDETGHVVRCAKMVAKTTASRLFDAGLDPKQIGKFLSRAESAAGINGALALLKTEPHITVTAPQLDANDYLLPCENGTLDLSGSEARLRSHRREDLLTRCLSTPFYPAAESPTWDAFLHRVMNGNEKMIAYLQRIFGLCLTGAANIHELFICYGSGANGKSVFCDTMLGLLGSFAGVAPDSLLVARNGQTEHPTELAFLKGKRVVVASETESGATLRLQLVKRLTGDSIICARFMRQDYFEFRRTHKMLLVTNNRPRITEDTDAVWRRLRIIPFTVVIPPEERDTNLIDRLKSEYPGILAWAVRGCIDWQRNGMQPPAEVLIATDDYRAEADDLADFFTDRCIVGANTFRVSRSELFTSYTSWAKASNERRPLDRPVFYEAVRRRVGVTEDRWKVDGVAVRGFRGIALALSGDRGSDV